MRTKKTYLDSIYQHWNKSGLNYALKKKQYRFLLYIQILI
jgi:hypothetical protein